MSINQRQQDALKLMCKQKVMYYVTENYPLSRSTIMALHRRGLVYNYRDMYWKINSKGRKAIGANNE